MGLSDLTIKVIGIGLIYYVAFPILIKIIKEGRNIYLLKKKGSSEEATIVDLKKTKENNSNFLYSPIVEYCGKEGNKKLLESNVTFFIKPKIGQKVTVTYQKDNPESARINVDRILIMSILSIILLVTLIVFLFISLVQFIQDFLR